MASPSIICPTCDSSWANGAARYCGRCGAPLEAPPRTTGPRRRGPALAIAGLAAGITVFVAAGTLVTGVVLGSAAGDPEVMLPERGTVPTGPPLSSAEADVLREQVDPERLRCQPRGCELWRRDSDTFSQVAATDDLLVLLEADRLVAIDATDGEQRWAAPLQDLVTVTGDGDPVRPLDGGELTVVLGADPAGIVVATDRAIVVIDLDGTRRWRTQSPDWTIWDVALTGDRVVLSGAAMDRMDEGGRLLGLDLNDGQIRWQREATPFLGGPVAADASVLFVSDAPGTVQAIDPSNGETRWERSLTPDQWFDLGGPWLGVSSGDGSTHVLLDPLTGEELGELRGVFASPVVAVGDRFLTVLAPSVGREGSAPPTDRAELTALTADGDVAWSVPFETFDGTECCTWLTHSDGLVTSQAAGERLRVDVRTGELLDRSFPTTIEGHIWPASDGTMVRWTPRGLILERDEMEAHVLGSDVWIQFEDPWVIGGPRGQLLGIQLVPPS